MEYNYKKIEQLKKDGFEYVGQRANGNLVYRRISNPQKFGVDAEYKEITTDGKEVENGII